MSECNLSAIGSPESLSWSLDDVDPEIAKLAVAEKKRQASVIRLIPSENYASSAVVEAEASAFSNKYSEGYPYKWKKSGECVFENGRYYQGQEFTNQVERLCMRRALELFVPGKESDYHANVQPLSGSPANLAVLNALLKPGETFMGLALNSGGHLTHGHTVSVTSQYYNACQFGVGDDHYLDYDKIEQQALQIKPKLILAGTTAYPRVVDFERLGRIAKSVGALLVADIAHISGLVATGEHPAAFPHVDVVTMTTHKMLRGPRGGIIICRKELGPDIDRSVFPGLQGGPHMSTIAGIAVALHEALQPAYRVYTKQVRKNAKAFASALSKHGFDLVTGGTDNHLMVINTSRGSSDVAVNDGTWLAEKLEDAGIVANKNSVPGDTKPWKPSGVRVGTPAVTTLGMNESHMQQIANWFKQVATSKGESSVLSRIKSEVEELMGQFSPPK